MLPLRFWWVPLVRGLTSLGLGIAMLVTPASFPLRNLIVTLAVYFLLDGMLSVFFSFRQPDRHRWWLFASGAVSVLVAALIFFPQGVTHPVLQSFIACWAIITGIGEIIYPVRNWSKFTGRAWMLLGGILNVVFGVLMFAHIVSDEQAVVWVIGLFRVAFSLALILLGVQQFRKYRKSRQAAGAAGA